MSRKPLDKDLYADVVAEAKRKFDVWPSAYASGWVVKTYKARGGRYGGESKGSRTGLTKWFGESWVDLSRPIRQDGEVVGYEPCGRKRSGDPADYPKCRPAREAMRMTPAEVRDAIKRKRAAEAKAAKGRGGRGARAPVRVATYENPAPDTEAFRRWFGESKVVDENGEPLVVYHGTDKGGFYSFDMGEADAQRPGTMFFTSDRGLARTYTRGRSDPTPPYFKSVEDFLEYVKTEGDDSPWSVETEYYVASDEDETRYSDLDDLHEAWEDVADDEIGVVYSVFDVDGYDNGKFDSQNPKDMADLLSEVNRATTKKEGVYEVYLRIVDPYVVDAKGANWDGVPIEEEDEDGNPVTMTYTTNELARMAQDMGCDGLIVRDVYDSGRYGSGGESGDVFVVFDAKQIKSAHNIGTFDPTTDDIRRNPRRRPNGDAAARLGGPVVDAEEWDDGTVVEFVAVPFPYERKPLGYKDDPKVQGRVNLATLIATQRRVTKAGVEKYLDDLAGRVGRAEKIRVYQTQDGRQYIADGHHRAVAAWAAGVEVLPAVIQLVRENPTADLRSNPRAKVKPLTEREREDLPRANSFWMDFELENGPEWLPAALVDAEWPASPDDPELAREVLNLLYTRAPGDY